MRKGTLLDISTTLHSLEGIYSLFMVINSNLAPLSPNKRNWNLSQVRVTLVGNYGNDAAQNTFPGSQGPKS